jgi:HD-GYP domain-containing protein (c-di-GMP phosphodiesterase class II)
LQLVTSYSGRHTLGLKLKSVLVGELFLISKLTHPVYVFKDELFSVVIPSGSSPSKEQINLLIKNKQREVFLRQEDFEQIKKGLETALIKANRSLSVGDPLQNGSKNIKLLSLNMTNLYQNPHNDELLMLQFQSSQNLSNFLLENKKHQSDLYHNFSKENFHYTIAQPMLSSILLLSFLQSTHLFHKKEIESLFLTSYFKDFGLSIIPEEKYDLKTLSPKDKEILSDHSEFSLNLLDGRIPLSKSYLNIIKEHHFLHDKMKTLINPHESTDHSSDILMGIETILVAVFDILVATINDRPYRKKWTTYQALELIKRLMADDYPQEFKALVIFLKQFLKN